MNSTALALSNIDDPVNAAILAVSEDRVQGFDRRPLNQIAEAAGVPVAVVIERVGAMLRAGQHPPGAADAAGHEPGARGAGGVEGGRPRG